MRRKIIEWSYREAADFKEIFLGAEVKLKPGVDFYFELEAADTGTMKVFLTIIRGKAEKKLELEDEFLARLFVPLNSAVMLIDVLETFEANVFNRYLCGTVMDLLNEKATLRIEWEEDSITGEDCIVFEIFIEGHKQQVVRHFTATVKVTVKSLKRYLTIKEIEY